MKVVVTALHWFPDCPSGSSQLAGGHARELARRGHEVWFVAQATDGAVPEHAEVDGIQVLRYPPPHRRGFDPRRATAHQMAVSGFLNRWVGDGVDAVHGHSLLPTLAALDRYGKTAATSYHIHSPARAEFRATARGASPLEAMRLALAGEILHRLEWRVLRRTDILIANSIFTRDRISEVHARIDSDRIQVVPGWVDENRFQPVADREALKRGLGLATDRPVFFALRRLVPRMGLDRLIRALSRLARRGARFQAVIGGDGPLRSTLEEQSRVLGLGDAVVFRGRVPDADLPGLYAAADAFVLPTAELECFGLIALEAMASGRPVLATPVAAIPEIVGRFEPAWLARDPSSEAIEEVIRKFLAGELPVHDPNVLSARVKEQFGAANVLPRLLEATRPRLVKRGDVGLGTSSDR